MSEDVKEQLRRMADILDQELGTPSGETGTVPSDIR